MNSLSYYNPIIIHKQMSTGKVQSGAKQNYPGPPPGPTAWMLWMRCSDLLHMIGSKTLYVGTQHCS